MNAADVVAALDLPAGARLDQRVPKKLLVEHGAPTGADKRRINAGVEEVRWIATLKPTTIGVPLFRDEARDYLEIAVLAATLRTDAKAGRLVGVMRRGWVVGERGEVRFRYRPADPGLIEFQWANAYGVRAGVRYDDTPCVARPGFTCIARGDPLDSRYTYYARFF